MGSRRRRYAALVAALLGGCTVGAPPGFSEGESWTIPLIGPLEDGLLLVPALINGKGPYVLLVDPDAHVSIVDQQVLKETAARVGEGPHLLDESDTQQARFYAEILDMQLGTLTFKGPKPAQAVPAGTFDAGGRRIHGVLGRDLIAESLVLSFDRDAGALTLATQKGAKPTGTAITYSLLHSRIPNAEVRPISRKLVTASVNGVPFALHVDFGAAVSQLRTRAWPKAKLTPKVAPLVLVDEVGMTREVKQEGVADTVSLGGITAQNVSFVPYADRRWPDQDLEGTLGLPFFKPFAVTANWDSRTIYLRPRTEVDAATRIGRWQSKTLSGCANLGCIKGTVIDPLANAPAETKPAQHPGVVVSFTRDATAAQLDLEVLVEVKASAATKWLLVNIPYGADRAMTHLSADFIGATMTVLDASPFPRQCPAEGGCVDIISR